MNLPPEVATESKLVLNTDKLTADEQRRMAAFALAIEHDSDPSLTSVLMKARQIERFLRG